MRPHGTAEALKRKGRKSGNGAHSSKGSTRPILFETSAVFSKEMGESQSENSIQHVRDIQRKMSYQYEAPNKQHPNFAQVLSD